ncbi:hypothetical protein IMG5_124930 [Ichthyophthirius multifiliis]|uniref:MSP domain-containing protein n=1 Tax=Ichthyophthirius multifiliis TaxID=5932 RepID=G0QVN9_ICHMU|nr:hypothetical protein IMG5_124930 [Ichthyophthirius multifiliis]EGR30726.1 hypothetical protein IMG5_124930 [Ichthyophthirius multifiliis]|eukprot:XP_004032313.1 hypothetical protein IMG5_124930 [Ichthyophthirius multifiliis]
MRPTTSVQAFQKPQYLNQMSILEKLKNEKIIQNMNKRINYLKNPRFKQNNKPPIQFTEIKKRNVNKQQLQIYIYSQKQDLLINATDQKCPFKANPQIILFKDYLINEIYKINLTIINTTSILRRIKFLPPQLEQFTITSIIYPGEKEAKNEIYQINKLKEVGLIAPGMSLQLTVQFKVTSFAQYEDKITFISEDSIFEVPLISQKEKPQITLPEILNCKSCWVGDKTETVFRIQNRGGESGFKFFLENEDEENNYNNCLKATSFSLYPCEFFLSKNEEMQINVTFCPKQEGHIQEKIILACDNLTFSHFCLEGNGNLVDLEIYGIDNIKFDIFQEQNNEFIKQIFFENAYPQTKIIRKLKIKNKTSVEIKYHWALFKNEVKNKLVQNENNNNNEFFFQIEPEKGIFEKEQILTFSISYFSQSSIPQFEFASLIIEDISLSSIKNPPQILKKMLLNSPNNIEQIEELVEKPAFFASNSSRQSISFFDFQLIGLGMFIQIEVEPSYHVFVGNLFIGKSYFWKFTLKNNSSCPVSYCIQPFQLQYDDQNVFPDIPQSQSQILEKSNSEVFLGFKSLEVGQNKKITYQVIFNYSQPIFIDLIGNFIGPEISLDVPEIDFGLLQVGQEGLFQLNIKNESGIQAEVLFQEEFDNSLKFKEEENNLKNIENYLDLYQKKQENNFIFDNKIIFLGPFEQKTVNIKCLQNEPKTINTILGCLVKDGKINYIRTKAEIQKINVSLNTFQLNFERIYISKEYRLMKGQSEQYIELQNLGNLQCKFSWELDTKQQMLKYTFEPSTGILKAKEVLPIKFTFIPQLGGNFEEIFICNIEGVEYPLGFELKSYIQGLTIEFDNLQQSNNQNNDSIIDQKDISKQIKNKILNKTQTEKKNSFTDKKISNLYTRTPLKSIEFYECLINQQRTFQISIRNTSEIPTSFEIFPEKYLPFFSNDKESVTNTTEKMQEITYKTGTSSLFKKNQKKRQSFSAKPQVLLTNDIEKNKNFTSIQGQQLNQTKILLQNQRIYLSNNKGIAILCEPNKGKLPANSEVLIIIACFNDICGHFKDNLIININGYPQQKFPMEVEVIGSPVIINPGQLGILNNNQDWPIFNLGQYIREQTPITRQFKIMNTGPKDVIIEWKLFDLKNIDRTKDMFQIQIQEPHLGTQDACLLHFEPLQPQEVVQSDIQIEQKQFILEGREEKIIKVNFQSKEAKNFDQVLVARPYLRQKNQFSIDPNEKNDNMGTVAIRLQAQTINPYLYIDKLKSVDGILKLKFEKWSCQEIIENKKELKEITLINKFNLNLKFQIHIIGPFKIMQAATNSPASYDQEVVLLTPEHISYLQNKFNLVQNSNLSLKIEFQGPKANNYQEWPLTYKTYKFGKLQILFENGDQQNIELEGHLLRPLVYLNTSGIEDVEGDQIQDFDTVNINNYKSITIFLSNISQVPAKWKINNIKAISNRIQSATLPNMLTKEEIEDNQKVDDPSVFEFQISQGILIGPSVPVKCFPDTLALPNQKTNQIIADNKQYPQKIMINFRVFFLIQFNYYYYKQPRKNVLYKCKYRIIVEEGPSVDFFLRGRGTYDEKKYK